MKSVGKCLLGFHVLLWQRWERRDTNYLQFLRVPIMSPRPESVDGLSMLPAEHPEWKQLRHCRRGGASPPVTPPRAAEMSERDGCLAFGGGQAKTTF